jgi:hypothetical protein
VLTSCSAGLEENHSKLTTNAELGVRDATLVDANPPQASIEGERCVGPIGRDRTCHGARVTLASRFPMAAPSCSESSLRTIDAEQRLAELSRASAPLRRMMAAIAGRLVARQGWARLGYARPGDYARERLGLSVRTLQELARVDRAVSELPRLEAAWVSGRLPWSKVRLLARAASPDDEARWIATATRLGVRALERACRAVDRGALETGGLTTDEEGHDAGPSECVRLSMPIGLAFKWKRTQKAAALVAAAPIPPAEVLEMVTAEALSGLPAGVPVEAAPEDRSARTEGAPSEPAVRAAPAEGEPEATAPHAELPRFLRPLVEGLEHADAFELDARLRRAVRLEQRLDSEIAPLLRLVTSAEHDWRERFHTRAAFARERLGMSPRKARALLRLERAGDVCPELREAYRDGTLSWVQAQALAPLLLVDIEGGWRRAWVAWATRVAVRRLEAVVDHALWLREADPQAWSRAFGDPDRIDAALDGGDASGETERQTCARPTILDRNLSVRVRAPRDVVRLFRAVLCSVRKAIERETGRLPSEAEGFEAMLDHAIESWRVDDRWQLRQLRHRHAVFERDGWRCSVPGCTSQRNLQAHHVVFRSGGARMRPATRRRCAPSTTSAACTAGRFASRAARPTPSGSSSASARAGPRWRAIAPEIVWRSHSCKRGG